MPFVTAAHRTATHAGELPPSPASSQHWEPLTGTRRLSPHLNTFKGEGNGARETSPLAPWVALWVKREGIKKLAANVLLCQSYKPADDLNEILDIDIDIHRYFSGYSCSFQNRKTLKVYSIKLFKKSEQVLIASRVCVTGSQSVLKP